MTTDRRILGLVSVFALSGCATVLDEDGALAITPYAIEEHGRIIIEARVNDEGPFAFALDTAASISVVFDNLRNELELGVVPGRAVIIHGSVASDTYPLLNIDRLEVGNEAWVDPRIASMPGETGATVNIDGVLGVDFLRRYAVGFSTRDRVLRLYPPDLVTRRSYRGWASVPLELEHIGEGGAALYFLEIELGGQKIPAVFDLGAGLNLLNWAAARSLGIVPTDLRDDEVLSGAIDTVPVVAHVMIDEVTTGRIRWRNEEFTIADLKIFETIMHGFAPCAILGVGLFNQRDFIIDFARGRLLVKVAMDEVDVVSNSGDDALALDYRRKGDNIRRANYNAGGCGQATTDH